MDKKSLIELLEYASPNEIYIIDFNGDLKKLTCPFKVKVLYSIDILEKNDIVFVDSVKVTMTLVTVFIVNGRAYFYYHFDIE